jgi:hypothetical protein
MKQILNYDPPFSPNISGAGTIDFTQITGFDSNKLYGVVNITRGTPLYVPGTAKYSGSFVNSILTLTVDTSSHAQSDKLLVYYQTTTGLDLNVALENGGNLEALQETSNRILKELQVLNYVLATGLNIKKEDVDSIRDDLFKGANNVATD